MAKGLTLSDIAECLDIPDITQMAQLTADVKLSPARRKILATKCLPQAAMWSRTKKAEYSGVTRKTWYLAERDPEFRKVSMEFVKERFGDDLPEILASYILLAKLGDRQAMERLLEQGGILDKPKAGDINVNVVVSMEERKKLEQTRITNQSRGLRNIGYALISDN